MSRLPFDCEYAFRFSWTPERDERSVLEMSDRVDELTPLQRTDGLLRNAAIYARAYIRSLENRPPYPPEPAVNALKLFDDELPAEGLPPEVVIDELQRLGSDATTSSGGGRYFGFVNGGCLPVGLAARFMADAWDQNSALEVMSPLAARLEEIVERWIKHVLGFSSACEVGFVSGSSVATICALATARNEQLKRLGWNVEENGLNGAPPLRVIASERLHSSVFKALRILGFGRRQIEHPPVDGYGRVRFSGLPKLDPHCLIILQAGEVNTGAFDFFELIVPRAQAAGAWVHVDGAFGLWAAASPKLRTLVAGVESANSWTIDAHKTLNAPYDSGFVICRNPGALSAAMSSHGAYLTPGNGRDGMSFVPEMSRRARSIELWAVLVSLGQNGVAALVEQLCERAQELADGLRQIRGLEVVNNVEFNQVLVRAGSDEHTDALLQQIQDGGEIWCGGSRWNGRRVIRISVCSWRTTQEDVELALRCFGSAVETFMAA